MNRHLEFSLIIALITIYFAWFAWPLIWTASENARLVSVFNSDEAMHLRMVKEAISQRTFRLEFGNYGHLCFNIALLPLLLLSYFKDVSEQQIIVVLRLISTLFAIATIAVTFALTRRYIGRFAAWLAASLLSIVPLDFLHLSVMSHPDIPQLFFLVLSVYFCCRFIEEEGWKWLIWASASAGLAFACKYSGMFLLPAIWMVGAAQTIRNDRDETAPIVQFITVARYLTVVTGILGIIIGFVVTPEFAARYLTASGRIDDPSILRFLNFMRITTILTGCCLMIVAILGLSRSTIGKFPKLANVLKKMILSSYTFGVAFFLASPYSFVRLNFLKGMYLESRHTAFGHWFEATDSGLMWFHVLLSPQLLDTFILGLAAISLALSLYSLSRSGWRRVLSPEFVMWAWVILYMGFLILRVNMRPARYLLPVVPFLIILSTQPVSQAINYATSKLSRKPVAVLAVAIVCIIGGLELPKSFGPIFEYRQSTVGCEQTSISVKAGQWLAEQYPLSTRILYDHYSYVPASFSDVHVTWGGTIQMLETLKPDIVIVNKEISNRFSELHQATRYFRGESDFKRKHQYYEALKSAEVSYVLVRDFGDVQVYERQ